MAYGTGYGNPRVGDGNVAPYRHSRKIQTAHDKTTSKDIDDFHRRGAPGKPHRDVEPAIQDAVDPVQVVSRFASLGEMLHRTQTMSEVARDIAHIAETAEGTVMEEAGDWFDGQTIKRNMKEMNGYSTQFGKIAEEMDKLHQRATALYDDMGNVLTRYFEMAGPAEAENDEEEPFGGKKAPEFDGPGGNPADDRGRAAWDRRNGEDDEEVGEARGNIAHFKGKKAAPFDGPGGNPADDRGRHAWDMRDGDEEDEELGEAFIAEVQKHLKEFGENERQAQLYRAHRAIRTPKAFTRVVNNMTRDQALGVIKQAGVQNVAEARRALYKEVLRQVMVGEINLKEFLQTDERSQ